MADIASLGVVVRPDGIQQTTQQLDGLTKAGATAEKQAAKIAPAMDKAAKSAKELAFATRGLPAQFTDIAVSLQAGQSPLTVLLQQGGQIKDVFGGAVPALRAVGGYIASLLSPVTLLAAATAALAIAWRQGSNESVEFNKALALTNNYAGTTADRLQVMAAQLSALGVTQGAAADALAEVATTGRFTEEQLRLVTEAAISMQLATGQAVEDTVKEYAKLADDPVKAVVQLNEKYHFLTESVYEQIKALQQQGREQDAATLAIETFARTHTQRAQEVIASADGITKAWRDIKFGISDAFDTLRNFGRLQSEVGRASYNIAQAQNQLRGIAERLRGGRDPFSGALFTKEQIAEDRRRIEELKKIIEDSQRVLSNDPKVAAARKQAAAQRANDAAIAIDQEATSYASATDKLKAKQVEARGRADEAIRLALASGNKALAEQIESDSKVIQAAIDKQIKDAEKRAAPKVRKVREKADPADGIVSRIKEQIALNEAEQQTAERLTASERLRISVMADLEKQGEKVTASRREQIDALLGELDASGKSLEAIKEEARAKQNLAEITNELALAEKNRAEANRLDLMSIGRGADEVDQLRRRLDIEREYEDNLQRLNDRAASERRQVSDEELRALQESRDRNLRAEEQYQARRLAMLGDWRNGARAAFEDFAFEAADAAGAAYSLFQNAFDGLTNVITDFATKGKGNFRSFLNDLGTELTRFFAKKAVMQFVSMFAGSFGGATAAPSTGFASSFGNNTDWLTAFGGGRAAGGPVSGNKLYEVGENGRPELFQQGGRTYLIPGNDGVVNPIASAPGQAGARASSGGNITFNQEITVNSDGTASTSTTTSDQGAVAKALGDRMRQVAQAEIIQQMQPGGLLYSGRPR